MFERLRALIGGRSSSGRTAARRKIPLAVYDHDLKAEFSALPVRIQTAFAAACAERLFPAYAEFLRASHRDDDGLVRHVLDLAWEGAKSGTVADADPNDLFERCVALIPSDEDEDAIPQHADDAIAAAAYALQAAAGLDENAAGWAAQRGTDTLDNYLLSNEIDQSLDDADQRVWEHPLVVAEIQRRAEDLRRLRDVIDWELAVDAVRQEATRTSVLPLDVLSHEI
jgi:uncharacterized protein YjaG (DUF416 family)